MWGELLSSVVQAIFSSAASTGVTALMHQLTGASQDPKNLVGGQQSAPAPTATGGGGQSTRPSALAGNSGFTGNAPPQFSQGPQSGGVSGGFQTLGRRLPESQGRGGFAGV